MVLQSKLAQSAGERLGFSPLLICIVQEHDGVPATTLACGSFLGVATSYSLGITRG